MNNCRKTKTFWFFLVVIFSSLTTLYAGTQPKFTLIPTTPTTVSVLSNAVTTVQYTVTNKTKVTRTLTMKPIAGITQTTSGAGICTNPFTLAHNQSCSLTLQINGAAVSDHITSGPEVCKTMSDGDNTPDPFLCSQPSQNDSLNITRVAPANISANPAQLNLVAGGQTRIITITNNSNSLTATNIAANFTGTALDGYIIQDASNCEAVQPSQSCVLTFTSENITVPLTSFPIQGDNTTQITASIEITFPTIAPISVSGSPVILQATTGTPETKYLTVTNKSTLLEARNVQAVLTGTLATQVTQDASACATIPAGGSFTCNLAFTPIQNGTAVQLTGVEIIGTNTTSAPAQIAVNSAAQAPISVSNSPLTLLNNGTSSGTMIITNESTTDAALNVAANFTGTDLVGSGVTATSSGCNSIAPNGGTCTITFTAGTQVLPATTFTIQGTNTTAVSAIINVTLAKAVLSISPVPSVLNLVAGSGIPGIFTITNLSQSIIAENITPHLSSLLAGAVTLTNNCLPTLAVNSSCTMEFMPLDTAITLEGFGIYGDNTTQVPGSIQIQATSVAQIAVSGSPLTLQAPGGTGSITVTNTSDTAVTAEQILAFIDQTALATAGVTQDVSGCASLAQGASCELVFTAGTEPAVATTVNVFGNNTSIATATISVNGIPNLSVSPTSLALLADGKTQGSMTVTNLSTTTAATGVTAILAGTALDGKVSISINTCSNNDNSITLPPGGTCTISYLPGTTIVADTTFDIAGTNTSTVAASMSIGSYFAYVSNGSTVSKCIVNVTTGLLSGCVNSGPSFFAASASTINPAGKFIYVYDEFQGIIKCSINKNGQLSLCSTYGTSVLDTRLITGLAFAPSGLYLNVVGNNKVQRCTVATDGSLSACQQNITVLPYAVDIAINPANTFAYATINYSPYGVSQCPITNNVISESCTTPTTIGGFPYGIALDPQGAFAYVGNFSLANVTSYSINPSDGALSSQTSHPIGVNSSYVAVNSLATFLYVTDVNNRKILMCPIAGNSFSTCVDAASGQTFTSTNGLSLWEHPTTTGLA